MSDEVKKAVEVMKKGGVILYPTDTIWGLGCDATNEDAVRKIYAIKQRKDEKSMLVLLDDAGKLTKYVETVPDIAWNILEVSDKPLTIIYPGAQNLAGSLIAEDGSIGIRITRDEFCCNLIRLLARPIVSTSANISGTAWPANFKSIQPALLTLADYVVEYRQNETYKGKPSGIIKLGTGGEVKVIRE